MEESPHIHLSYKQNSFSIAFSAIDYSDYKHIHYFYQMAGFDNTWIDAGNNNEAYYSNLPAGNYTFKVKMVGSNSDNTIAEKSIQVSIAPEPWNSWWALPIPYYNGVRRLRDLPAEDAHQHREEHGSKG